MSSAEDYRRAELFRQNPELLRDEERLCGRIDEKIIDRDAEHDIGSDLMKAEHLFDAAKAALAELGQNKQSDPLPAIAAMAAIDDELQRQLLIGHLAALRVPGLTKALIEKNVKDQRAKADVQLKSAAEATRRDRLRATQIEPTRLFEDMERFFSERAWLPPYAATVMSLFAVLTHCPEHFSAVPYLCVESATPGCGKSTCLTLLSGVVARPMLAAGLSRAVLVRRLDRDRVTLLLDESEWLKSHDETAQAVKAILHSGYRRGATYQCCEGEHHELREFQVFGPKAFNAIGGLTGALLDRCIVIHLEKAPTSVTLTPAGVDDLGPDAGPLQERLEAFTLQAAQRLKELQIHRPKGGYWPEFKNREGDLWHPMLSIARIFGPEVEQRALEAAREFSGAKAEIQSGERHIALGRELVEALENQTEERFRPADVIPVLAECEVWGEVLAGKKTDKGKAATVGHYLKAFRLSRYKRESKGSTYDREETVQALKRHIPSIPKKSATPATAATDSSKSSVPEIADKTEKLPPVQPVPPVEARPVGECLADETRSMTGDESGLTAGNQHKQRGGGRVADVAVKKGGAEDISPEPGSIPTPADGELTDAAYSPADLEAAKVQMQPWLRVRCVGRPDLWSGKHCLWADFHDWCRQQKRVVCAWAIFADVMDCTFVRELDGWGGIALASDVLVTDL